MAGILDRLRADLGMNPLATPATLATNHGAPVLKVAQSQLSQKGRLLPANLERRIRAMAERWQYTADDLAFALEDAQARSETWLACCKWDEQLHDNARRAGMRWPH